MRPKLTFRLEQKWKLLRGKFRIGLQSKVSSNTAELVQASTAEALSILRSDTSPASVRRALDVLTSKLHGVGPATASAILTVLDPTRVAFMSDEAMAVAPGIKAGAYTAPNFVLFNRVMCDHATRLSSLECAPAQPQDDDDASSADAPKRTRMSDEGAVAAARVWTPSMLERALFSLDAEQRQGSKVGKRKR
jgi:hypothetical protein